MLLGIYRIAIELDLDLRGQVLALLVAGLCTPLWFYAIVFWEHAIATCLCIWAALYALRHLGSMQNRDLIGSATLAAAAIYLREDLAGALRCGAPIDNHALRSREEGSFGADLLGRHGPRVGSTRNPERSPARPSPRVPRRGDSLPDSPYRATS